MINFNPITPTLFIPLDQLWVPNGKASIYCDDFNELWLKSSDKYKSRFLFLVNLYDYEYFGNGKYEGDPNILCLKLAYEDYLDNGHKSDPYCERLMIGYEK